MKAASCSLPDDLRRRFRAALFGLLTLFGLLALLAACASPPPQRFYTLSLPSPTQGPAEANTGGAQPSTQSSAQSSSRSTPATAPFPVSYSIVIAPVTLPEMLDRPQLVVRTAPNRVQLLDDHRWAEPLKEQIARVLAANLSHELPQAQVQTSRERSGLRGGTQWQLNVDIRRLEVVPAEAVTLEARWTLRATGEAARDRREAGIRAGDTLVREPLTAPGLEAAVAAHDRALSRMSAEVADALRATADAAR